MARAVANVAAYVETDKDGVAQNAVLWTYDITDGAALKKSASLRDESPDFTKIYHNTGVVGEFWRDGVDAIKTAEGV